MSTLEWAALIVGIIIVAHMLIFHPKVAGSPNPATQTSPGFIV